MSRHETVTRERGARGQWPMRDHPTTFWLVVAAAVALLSPALPDARWILVHAVLLGAVTHAVLVWSTHFTQALLKTSAALDPRPRQNARLTVLLAGAALVILGVPWWGWWAVVAGALAVTGAVGWHAWALWRRLRAALPGRFRITVRYYLCAAAWIPVGATLGALLSRGPDDFWHGRLLVAHTSAMVLGWLGLTVTGTLVTLWPTMLRTRIDASAETLARQALPVLCAAVAVVIGGAIFGLRPLVVGSLLLYAVGLGWWGRALWRPARQAPPREFGTWSVSAGLCWLLFAVLWVAGTVAWQSDWRSVVDGFTPATVGFAAGFGAQMVQGALTYLVPSVLGGGPAIVRSAGLALDRWGAARVIVVNAGLVVALLPVPAAVRVVVSALVVVTLAAFIPVLVLAVLGAVKAMRALQAPTGAAVAMPSAQAGPTTGTPAAQPVAPAAMPPGGLRTNPRPRNGQLVGGFLALLLAITVGVFADPAAAGLTPSGLGTPGWVTALPGLGGVMGGGAGGGSGFGGSGDLAAGVTPTGRTTTVRVEAVGMRFVPASVTVPAGDRLVIDLVNIDPGQTHDLVFASGARTARLHTGDSATLDLGVVGSSTQGWCSVVGHRLMGMVFDVVVTGATTDSAHSGSHGAATPTGGAAGLGGDDTAYPRVDLGQAADPSFQAVDAVLPPLSADREHHVTLRVQELELQVAPGVWQQRWTFGGQVPGPTLHGRVGDVFIVTLVNDGTIGHSIDFHAGSLAPDLPMRTIAPGESLVYRFMATHAGIWMYHCSTMPMSAHIAAGLHGAVVIEPEGLSAVDRSYVLVQSEVYLGASHAAGRADEVDARRVALERPDAVVFNGIANQYAVRPLTARVGERVRIWVLDAGPNRPTSFHVVGGQFDTVYAEGAWLLRPPAVGAGGSGGGDGGGGAAGSGGSGGSGGSQALALAAAQGGFVELVFPEAGHYPFVSHVMVDAERGARGIVGVTP